MQTRNYNDRLSRKIVLALLDGPMSVEQFTELANITGPEDEVRLHHTLVCLRYNTWIEDRGPVWQLTEGGREYAEWCREFPQRARRMKQDLPSLKAVAPVVNLKAS